MSDFPKNPNLTPSTFENFVLNRQKRKNEQMKSQLQYIQKRWNSNESLTHAELTYVIGRLSPLFEESEKIKLEEFKKRFFRTNLYCTAVSGINVFIFAAYFKSFLTFSSFKKVLFGLAVYLSSYEVGMFHVKRSLKSYNTSLLEKYKEQFLSQNFS